MDFKWLALFSFVVRLVSDDNKSSTYCLYFSKFSIFRAVLLIFGFEYHNKVKNIHIYGFLLWAKYRIFNVSCVF